MHYTTSSFRVSRSFSSQDKQILKYEHGPKVNIFLNSECMGFTLEMHYSKSNYNCNTEVTFGAYFNNGKTMLGYR